MARGKNHSNTSESIGKSDEAELVQLLRKSKDFHSKWYLETYPDVARLGMEPSLHYLRYGAAIGRNPGKHFDTRFYLKKYPDVAQSGINPLVHYLMFGEAEGRVRRPTADKTGKYSSKQVEKLRTKLLSLGFVDQSIKDLSEILNRSKDPDARSKAARELALWNMRLKTPEGWRKALKFIERARPEANNDLFREKLVTAELLCHYFLNDMDRGRAVLQATREAGTVTPDNLLAAVNFQTTSGTRLEAINEVLDRFSLAPLGLRESGPTPYDRLRAVGQLTAINEGPKITVLIAAYEAADTLPTTLRSLQEQTWKNLEILVLDDCSPSTDTTQVAEAFGKNDSRIRVIRMPVNGGAYVARNHGLDLASGDYVTIHDADDWSHPEKLEKQARFLMSNEHVIGCTTQQARIFSDLSFTRWTGQGQFLITNTSSFMFRRRLVRERLGYWDTVRFSADNELIRRIQAAWGEKAVHNIRSGPLSFQRDSETSIVADDALGINGPPYGVRRLYLQAQQTLHENRDAIRYSNDPKERPFPVPLIMRTGKGKFPKSNHYDVIIASEFRLKGGNSHSNAQDLICQKRAGLRSAIMPMYRYDINLNLDRPIQPEVWNEVDGNTVDILSYGEHASCDLLIVRYPPVLYRYSRFMPRIDAKNIKVVMNQPPYGDYSGDRVVRYELADCAENIRRYFGKDATWYPIGPLIRNALNEHHADELKHIHLSDEDWHNIIDIDEWDRGARKRTSADRLRIGRHSRDSVHKWPSTREDTLAAYPSTDDVEVHILGGAETPASLIGNVPSNWTVYPFGSVHPRDFLAELDVWIYFSHSEWVESFGRTIIEAMAVGVPVILPEIYRPLFADAAIYATPQTAVEIARKLHADPVAYDDQVERARRYVSSHFSYKMHIERLVKAGVKSAVK